MEEFVFFIQISNNITPRLRRVRCTFGDRILSKRCVICTTKHLTQGNFGNAAKIKDKRLTRDQFLPASQSAERQYSPPHPQPTPEELRLSSCDCAVISDAQQD